MSSKFDQTRVLALRSLAINKLVIFRFSNSTHIVETSVEDFIGLSALDAGQKQIGGGCLHCRVESNRRTENSKLFISRIPFQDDFLIDILVSLILKTEFSPKNKTFGRKNVPRVIAQCFVDLDTESRSLAFSTDHPDWRPPSSANQSRMGRFLGGNSSSSSRFHRSGESTFWMYSLHWLATQNKIIKQLNF